MKPKSKLTCKFKNCSHCAQMLHATQHGTILTIFTLNLQTNVICKCCQVDGRVKCWRLTSHMQC